MFRAPLEARLSWAAVAGTQIILLADGDHAHLAERTHNDTTTRRYPISEALHAWRDCVNHHLTQLHAALPWPGHDRSQLGPTVGGPSP